MAMIRPETEMKDTGIEWIGIIPSSWTIFPANGVFSEVKEKNMDLKLTNAFSFKYGEIVDKKQVGNVDNNLKETLSSYTIVRKNTIMINGLNLNYDFVSQRVAIVNESGVITSAYLAIQPDENKINPRFVLYLLKSYDYQQVFHGLGSGIRKTLKYQDFKKIMIVAPPLSEQQVIADYLDETCSKIDEIIAEAKASIDEYENLRQSIIYEILTKGPDDNVEMKDSGVEWIGKVPSHWMIGKVKYGTTKVGSGKTPKGGAEVYMTSGVMFLRSQNIYNDGLRLDNPYYISEEIDEEMKNTRVQKNDVLLNITGGSIGRCCIFDGSIPNANVNQHVCIIRVNSSVFLPEYMHLFWISPIGQISIKSYQTGGNREGMSAEAIKNTPIPIIPIGEQRRIVDLIKPKIDDFNSLITEKESLINDLEAYKKSLIYEVVTGKRRVV